MSCLDRIINGEDTYIGIKGVASCESPIWDLYINDLPGMSLKMASAIASEEYESGIKLMSDKIKLATRLVIDDFRTFIFPAYAVNSIVDQATMNPADDTITYVAPFAAFRGIRIERSPEARFTKIYIPDARWLAYETGTITVRIIDGPVTIEQTHQVTGQQWNYLPIRYKAQHHVVRIEVDNSSFSVALFKRKPCRTCKGGVKRSQYLDVDGWDGTRETTLTYGLDVTAQLICDEDEIVCSLLDRMKFIVWYRAGIEVLEEFLQTTRLNFITLDKKRAGELKDSLEEKYKLKYNTFRESLVPFLKGQTDICFNCRRSRYVQVHP